jgi:hypothetical protein
VIPVVARAHRRCGRPDLADKGKPTRCCGYCAVLKGRREGPRVGRARHGGLPADRRSLKTQQREPAPLGDVPADAPKAPVPALT